MIYSNKDVRRQDRLLTEEAARGLLLSGEYGVLSMIDAEGSVYSIPINYVWDGISAIYLHCATEGRKLRAIDKNQTVSYCVVGRTNVISAKFTTEYESIVLECTAHRNLSREEKIKALELLIDKFSAADKTAGMASAERSFERTEIIRMDIIRWSGKSKKVSPG